jgi:hypothetical protein
MSEREPVCRAHLKLGSGAGSTFFPGRCAGATWRRLIVREMIGLPNPPLTAGSFSATIFSKDCGLVGLYRFDLRRSIAVVGESGQLLARSFALERQKSTFASEPTCECESAPATPVNVGRRPPRSGCLDGRGRRGATIFHGQADFVDPRRHGRYRHLLRGFQSALAQSQPAPRRRGQGFDRANVLPRLSCSYVLVSASAPVRSRTCRDPSRT